MVFLGLLRVPYGALAMTKKGGDALAMTDPIS
jgi:hypothetical protein